ncbi:hypothetical protein ASD45_14465 [Pseudolabrys sp. Root1462]|uniref:hypothetical protein n=1 Tax=Pseudolabrys sp. Root1462 TaxID=1736466 RepID=UPI000702F62D|nr:hypothetical protein [Pseudolabrys sp. Root1462]KQZ01921.1 hypothetical protein ASD45_14465 [Pseudolabrys sp. Root1462]
MADPKTLKIEQELLTARAIAGGLFAVLTDLMIAHARVIGTCADDGILHVRAIADESLAKLEAEVLEPSGDFVDAGSSIRAKVSTILDAAEANARHALALPPTSNTTN